MMIIEFFKEDIEMSQICTCGAKMKKSEWPGQWRCENCGTVLINHNDDEYEYDNLYNDKPNCCQSCSNEMIYPECVSGCSLL